jgi:hypothetical protein
MTSIADIISNRSGRAGSGGAWRVERRPDDADPFPGALELWHYSTRMLLWRDGPDGVDVLDWSLGHGSVSDQRGMNTAFAELDLSYRYDRDERGGGPRLTELDERPSEGRARYLRSRMGDLTEAGAAERTSARLEAFLPDVTLIGPAAGAALHALVYGGAA